MKIIFISVAIHFTKYQYEISKYLKEKGIDIMHVTYSKECANYLKERNEPYIYMPDYLNSKYDSVLMSILEKEYNFKKEDILLGDYDLSQISPNKAYAIMFNHFLFWQSFIDKESPDMFIGSSERFVGMIPYYICKDKPTRFYFWSRCPIPGRFWLSQETVTGRVTNIRLVYESLKTRQLTTDEQKIAEDIISEVTSKKVMNYLVVGEPTVDSGLVKTFFNRLWLNLFVEKGRNPYARVIGIAWEKVKRIFRAKRAKTVYSNFDPALSYVFYPMHVPDDCQLLVRAPQYLNQLELIKQISTNLQKASLGTTLVVKEHPNNIGGVTTKELKEIGKLPNVILVNPNTSSHDIIYCSRYIVTINSTVGWEAILYGKPVITLAPCFYDCFEGILKNQGLATLAADMRIVEVGRMSKEDQLKYILSVYLGSYAGSFNFYPGKEGPSMKAENLQKIAEGVHYELLNGKKV